MYNVGVLIIDQYPFKNAISSTHYYLCVNVIFEMNFELVLIYNRVLNIYQVYQIYY